MELSFWLFIICLCTSSHSCSISVLLSEYPICLGCLRQRGLWDGERAHHSYVQIRWTERHSQFFKKWGKSVKASITDVILLFALVIFRQSRFGWLVLAVSSVWAKSIFLHWRAFNSIRAIWHHYIIVDVSAVPYFSENS